MPEEAREAPDPASEGPAGVTAAPARSGRRTALAGAWTAAVSLAALVAALALFIVDANRPAPPAETTTTINGRPASADEVRDVLTDAASRLIDGMLRSEDERSGADGPKADAAPLDIRIHGRPAERIAQSLLWAGLPLAVVGTALGVAARARGARGGAVWLAMWPIGVIWGVGIGASSCSM